MIITKGKCRLWVWKHTSEGYGAVRYKGKVYLAHRMMWQAFNGPIPKGMLVLHKCDTPACFNPNHLFLGTYLDNNRDRARKGRNGPIWTTKLNLEQVKAMRAEWANGNVTQTELGRRYGVSSHQAHVIVRNKSWKNV